MQSSCQCEQTVWPLDVAALNPAEAIAKEVYADYLDEHGNKTNREQAKLLRLEADAVRAGLVVVRMTTRGRRGPRHSAELPPATAAALRVGERCILLIRDPRGRAAHLAAAEHPIDGRSCVRIIREPHEIADRMAAWFAALPSWIKKGNWDWR